MDYPPLKRLRSRGTQCGVNSVSHDKSTQFGPSHNSYDRFIRSSDKTAFTTHKYLITNITNTKENALSWCFDNNLLIKQRKCDKCNNDMILSKCKSSDGIRWRCQKNGHFIETSIRKGSWFEKSNLTIEEVIEMTYWWTTGIDQNQIAKQMCISSSTAVDWDMFCRETCEVLLFQNSSKIGGKGVRVQIDESKFGKRKYHRGHRVDGQWVFGGIEEESRKNFLVAVEKRDRETLIPIIKNWILPGTTIVSDFWKPYDILSELDFEHLKVNHSVEFVNCNGDHTNKIEGHWRQVKSTLPSFGVKKSHFSSYMAEFMWRYANKDQDLFSKFICDLSSVYLSDEIFAFS